MMKVIISVVLLAVAVYAEPPRYRQQYQQQRQYYFAREQEGTVGAAPYPATGWKPEGPAFNLPQRQFSTQQSQPQYGAPIAPQQQYGAPVAPQQQYGAPIAPQQQYGAPIAPQQQYGAPIAPRQQYGAPQQQYGAPTGPQREYGTPEESTTTEAPNSTDEDEVSTVQSIQTESESEPVNSVNELEDQDDEGQDEKQPQKSGEYYVALPDGRLQRVRYVSRQDVEAMRYFAKIRAENVEPLRGPIYAYAPLQKLQILPSSLQVSVAPAVTAIAPADAKPQKLEIEPVTQIQYQYDNPSSVVPLAANPLSGSYAGYTASYQAPAASDPRYILTFQ